MLAVWNRICFDATLCGEHYGISGVIETNENQTHDNFFGLLGQHRTDYETTHGSPAPLIAQRLYLNQF